MRRDEIVIRSLIREWLVLEQAADDGASAGAEGAQDLSKLNSLTGQLDSMLDDFESELSDREGDEGRSVNEALGMFLAGFALSIPKIGKLALYGTAYIIKAYAKMVSKLGGGDQTNALARAEKFKEAGETFYKTTHGWILSFYAKVVELLFIAVASLGDPTGSAEFVEMAKSEQMQAGFMKVAKAIDFAVNMVLAVVAGKGAWGAANLGAVAAAVTETGFAAVKSSSVVSVIAAEFAEVAILFAEVAAISGISAALISEAMDEIREFFDNIRDAAIDGVQTVRQAAIAAGVVIALGAGPKTDEKTRDLAPSDDVAQVDERRLRYGR